MSYFYLDWFIPLSPAQLVEAVEYTNCISAGWQDRFFPHESPRYSIKRSDIVASVREFWIMLSTSSLPLLPGLLWYGVLVTDKFPSMGQIELCKHFTVCGQMTDLSLSKQMSSCLFNMLPTSYLFTNHIYGFWLNNLQGLLYHNDQPTPSLK